MSKMSWWLALACCLCLLPRMAWAGTKSRENGTEDGVLTREATVREGLDAFNRGDYTVALPILENQAEQGDASAQDVLAYMYENGWGTRRDFSKAVYWYRKAAMQGAPPSETSLGRMYQSGSGVERNDSYAAWWYQKAAEHNYPGARDRLNNLLNAGVEVSLPPELANNGSKVTAAQPVTVRTVPATLSAATRQKRSVTTGSIQFQTGEEILRGADGCGRIALGGVDPKYRQGAIDAAKQSVWDGVCADGLALGPGRLIYLRDNGELIGYSDMWMLDGRPIGRTFTQMYGVKNVYAGSRRESIAWNGEGYSRSISSREPKEPWEDQESLSVTRTPQDASQYVNFALVSKCGALKKSDSNHNDEPCIQESRQSPTGNYGDGKTHHYCKPRKCLELWQKLAAPLVAAFDELERAHAAEVASAKQPAERLLGPLTAEYQSQKAEAERLAAEEQHRVAAEAQRKALLATARQQEVTAASQARKPVSSPNLDALIKRMKESAK
ncbi:tetratricopeptide repeat protein [Hydrocarboniphaga effusa]|uniref:tetratricopeptide repeat protein n=1 Tax=Hydrocarboniphaga effusa TaxID=243629 RepID=UPI00398C09C4